MVLTSMVVLSREMAAQGMYPAVDPIASSSVMLDAGVLGERHVRIATEVRRVIEHYRQLQDVIALLGVEELGVEDRRLVERAAKRKIVTVTEAFTGMPGRSVALADTLDGCEAILDGRCDGWSENSLYMIGTLDEAQAKEAAGLKATA